jgi:hypothetical protein
MPTSLNSPSKGRATPPPGGVDGGDSPDGFPNHAIELLVSEVAQPRHEAIAQQVTKSEELFGKPCVSGMLVRMKDGVVLQQSIRHVKGFTRRTGDRAGGEYVLIIGTAGAGNGQSAQPGGKRLDAGSGGQGPDDLGGESPRPSTSCATFTRRTLGGGSSSSSIAASRVTPRRVGCSSPTAESSSPANTRRS